MTYETIFTRKFISPRHEKKNMGFRAFLGCFVLALFVCLVLKPYIGPLPVVSLEQSIASATLFFMSAKEVKEPQQSYTSAESVKTILQNFTNSRIKVFELNGDIRINGNSSTIFIPSIPELTVNSNWTTRPYARKGDKTAMANVRKFTIIQQTLEKLPHCTRSFSAPAIIFSTGGYAGNQYHDLSDLLIPLYSTSQQFKKNVIFLVADKSSWWISKYRLILENLSAYEIIDIDNDKDVLCFPSMIVGLKANKELNVDPLESPHLSTTNFTKFLRKTYSLNIEFINNDGKKTCRPRLLIISRKKTRHLTNEEEVAKMARSIGFKVVVREIGWEISNVSKFVNSFDIMIGVHGAGLTNMIFLPENAVLIQIVPFGLDNVATCYQEPTKNMKLRYLGYKVNLNESSLFGRYPLHSEIYKNPMAFQNKGWLAFRSIYMDNQDVNIDLDRFRKTLFQALALVCE